MVYGVRPGATVLLNPQAQPPAQAVFDPITRRAVRYVETIVPTIQASEAATTGWLPADKYYVNLGVPSGYHPLWAKPDVSTNWSFNNWDATNLRSYLRGSTSGAAASSWVAANYKLFWYSGLAGETSSYTPKNATTTTLRLRVTARHVDTPTTSPLFGLTSDSTTLPPAAGDHYAYIYADGGGNWALGTGDGSSTGNSVGSIARDTGTWHEFEIRWVSGSVSAYVDGSLIATRTTVLPAQPLALFLYCTTSSFRNDYSEALVSWE